MVYCFGAAFFVLRFPFEKQMLSDEVIDRYRLGMDEQGGGDRVTIPVADAKGVYRDVRRWLPIEKRRQGTAKMLLWTQGYGGARLFPIDQLEHDVVVLVEGELDALACISHGIPAITATTGPSPGPIIFRCRSRKRTW